MHSVKSPLIITHRPMLHSFLRVNYLLLIVFCAELLLLFLLFNLEPVVEILSRRNQILELGLLNSLWLSPLWPLFDARSRFQNYKQVKDLLYLHRGNLRLAKLFAVSSCQRQAVIAAADELGLGKECRQLFHQMGYRWYHLLPDVILRKPWFVFSPAWLRFTFFVPAYRPKVDFAALAAQQPEPEMAELPVPLY
jgi:hypothetical protein